VTLLGLSGQAEAGTVDQTQEAQDGTYTVGDVTGCACPLKQTAGQTFTAGLTGTLDQVDINVDRAMTTSNPLTVEIHSASSGCPAAAVLATGSVPAASIVNPGGTRWVSVQLSPAPSVVAGTQYGIVLRVAGAGTYYAAWRTSNVYPGGQFCEQLGDPGNSFTASPTRDITFRTYVAPPPAPVDPTPPTDPTDPPVDEPGPDTPTVVVDSQAPETQIDTGPKKRTAHPRASFAFSSDDPGATFQCALSGKHLDMLIKQFNDCASPRRYSHLDAGRYRFSVRAIDAANNVDATPAEQKFRIVD
jgi:hypothetical protein